MNTNRKTARMETKILLIILWVFYTVNFMYCDTHLSLEPGVLSTTMSGYTAGGTVKNHGWIFVGNRDDVRDSVLNDCPLLGIKVWS